MINDNIHPIDPTGFRIPTETEEAISETLKLCGVSGEDASMMFIEVMEKLGKNDNFSACCRSRDKNKLRSTLGRSALQAQGVSDTNVGDMISRKAAIDVADSTDYLGLSVEDVKKVTDEVVKGLKCLPSAPERKRGRWIRTRTMEHDGELYCDQCGQEHPEQKRIWNFCPNCGADMREGQDEYSN